MITDLSKQHLISSEEKLGLTQFAFNYYKLILKFIKIML